MRPRGVDHIDDRTVLCRRHLAERRAKCADHLQSRDRADQGLLQLLRDADTAAIVELPMAASGGNCRHFPHQVGSINPLRTLLANQTQKIHERNAVGRHHARLVMDLAQQRITATFHDAVNPGDADIFAATLAYPAFDRRDRVVNCNGADLDTENVAAVLTRAGRRVYWEDFHTSLSASRGLASKLSK